MNQQPHPHSPATRTPARVWIGLAIAVLLDVPVQLIWKALMLKYGSARGPAGPGIGWYVAHHQLDHLGRFLLPQVRFFLHQTRSWALLALFACQFFDWIWVLGNTDLSFAQPFTALSYVAVSTCAVVFFHEHLTPLRIAGMTAIVIGVLLVGSSEHKTTETPLPILQENQA